MAFPGVRICPILVVDCNAAMRAVEGSACRGYDRLRGFAGTAISRRWQDSNAGPPRPLILLLQRGLAAGPTGEAVGSSVGSRLDTHLARFIPFE